MIYVYDKNKVKDQPIQPKKRVDIVTTKLVREKTHEFEIRRITDQYQCFEAFRPYLEDKPQEHLAMIGLNAKNEPNIFSYVHIGSTNSSLAVPRDFMRLALLSNSTSMFIAHNHPSGDPNPSPEDIQFTDKLVEAGKFLKISVLDHLIIGSDGRFCSIRAEIPSIFD